MKKHKRPKILYRYQNHTVDKYEVGPDDLVQVEIELGDWFGKDSQNTFGTLWRIKGYYADTKGYAKLSEAKAEEIENTKLRIYEDQQWLKKLTNKK